MHPNNTDNPKTEIDNSQFKIQNSKFKIPSPDDLAFIRALADEHSVGLPARCEEYRRKVALRRSAVAAICVVVTVAALLIPPSQETFVNGNLQCCASDACERINLMLAEI